MSEVSMGEVPTTKIGQPNLERIITDVAKKADIERGKPFEQPETLFSPPAQKGIKSADAVTQEESKKHSFNKVREAFKFFTDKGRLALATATMLVAFGCGTGGPAENPNVSEQSIRTPTPAVMPSPDFKNQIPDTLQPYTPQASVQKESKELESVSDLIPEKELEERFGIKIFNLKGHIELGFRRGAEKDSMFQRLEKRRDIQETYIVLVNGPYLDAKFLTAEQKAGLNDDADKEVIGSFTRRVLYDKEDARKWFEDKKQNKLTEYYRLRQELESKQSALSKEKYEVEHLALEYQYAPFLNGPTDEDLINASEKTIGGNIGKPVNINGKQVSRYYVFLAVKDIERTRNFKVGNEEIEVLKPGYENINGPYVLNPDPSQSYPSPDSLTIDLSHPKYPIQKGLTPGIIARHEFRHLRGSPHPQADLNLISDIDTAYQNYKNNGDDSGYWVVFKTQKGPVITERRTPEAQKALI